MPSLSPIWYPTHAALGRGHASMTWSDLAGVGFDEPFFHQTVRRAGQRATHTLPLGKLPAPEWSALAGAAPPAAFIFHVSRCGSTLLCHLLRSLGNIHLVAEAQPFSALLAPSSARHRPNPLSESEQLRQTLLRQVCQALAQNPFGQRTHCVIKCTSYSAMQMGLIRAIWPQVPIVFLTRDPAEVIVSHLNRPPGWVKAWNHPRQAASLFGWPEDTAPMSQEAFFARGFGSVCEAALAHLGPHSLVLDYEALVHHDGWSRVLRFLGLEMPDTAAQTRLATVLATDAKARNANQAFSPDGVAKRHQASSLVKESAAQWAYPALQALVAHHASPAMSK